MNKKIIKLTDGDYVINEKNNNSNKSIKKCIIIEFSDDKLINDDLSDEELLDIVERIINEKQNKKQSKDKLKNLKSALQFIVNTVRLEKPYDLLPYIDRVNVSAEIVKYALDGKIPTNILKTIQRIGCTEEGYDYLKKINLFGIYLICDNLNDSGIL